MNNQRIPTTFDSFEDFMRKVNPENKRLYFEVDPTDYQHFLNFAKGLGCKWAGGSQINPEEDNCFIHMSLSTDKRLAFVNMMAWSYMPKERVKRLSYTDLKEGILSEAVRTVCFFTSPPLVEAQQKKEVETLLRQIPKTERT